MTVSDWMYCYGSSVLYHFYRKPIGEKVLDAGKYTFEQLMQQPLFLKTAVVASLPCTSGELTLIIE